GCRLGTRVRPSQDSDLDLIHQPVHVGWRTCGSIDRVARRGRLTRHSPARIWLFMMSTDRASQTVIFIRLGRPNDSHDLTTLVGSGMIVGGPEAGVFGATSPRQLEVLRREGVPFEGIRD